MAEREVLSRPAVNTPFEARRLTLEDVCAELGIPVKVKASVRFPIAHLAELQEIVQRLKLTGRLSFEYSQGRTNFVSWEETK